MKNILSLLVSIPLVGCVSSYAPQNLTESSPTILVSIPSVGTQYIYSVIDDPCGEQKKLMFAGVAGQGGLFASDEKDFPVRFKENQTVVIEAVHNKLEYDFNTSITKRIYQGTRYFQFTPELNTQYSLSSFYGQHNLKTIGSNRPPKDFKELGGSACPKKSDAPANYSNSGLFHVAMQLSCNQRYSNSNARCTCHADVLTQATTAEFQSNFVNYPEHHASELLTVMLNNSDKLEACKKNNPRTE